MRQRLSKLYRNVKKEQRLGKVALTSGVEGKIPTSAEHIPIHTNVQWNMKKQSEHYSNIVNAGIKSLVDNILETGGIEARKTGNIRPTKAGLSDCKSTGNDVTLLFGITNPYSFEYPSYLGYDITKLKDNFRVMEVILNRHGKSNGLCPLFFDGAVNFFTPLPSSSDMDGLNLIYNHINSIARKVVKKAYTFYSFEKVTPLKRLILKIKYHLYDRTPSAKTKA